MESMPSLAPRLTVIVRAKLAIQERRRSCCSTGRLNQQDPRYPGPQHARRERVRCHPRIPWPSASSLRQALARVTYADATLTNGGTGRNWCLEVRLEEIVIRPNDSTDM